MPRPFSIYLDLLRVIAALTVFGVHAAQIAFRLADVPTRLAHDAVIVFFVLSGYVIAFSARERDRDLATYAINRGGRIYSVALPAVLLTLALDVLAAAIDSRPLGYPYAKLWLYLPFYLAFATDWWFLAEDMLSNVPYWSLSYEVAYYALFAAFFFYAGVKRIALLVLILAIVGIKVWVLLPIWAAGCAVYHLHRHLAMPRATARLLFFGSLIGFAAIKYLGLDAGLDDAVNALLGGLPRAYLRYSRTFAGDVLVGGLVALNILAARDSDFRSLARRTASRPIAAAAAVSFSFYLYHYPLLLFADTVGPAADGSIGRAALGTGLVAVAIVLLAQITERRKPAFRAAVARVASAWSAMLDRLPALRRCFAP
ncbi:MAG: acyltransferase [Proteobacteria bacterium]|nr:acyltransferase [Pseudomonadota bacterium]